MSFLSGECRNRWTSITHRPISDRGARTLDITVLAPTLALTGAFVAALPKLIRYGLVSVGVGLLAWNAFNLIDLDGESPTGKKALRDLDILREAGL
jgi:hypothetical protein